MHEEQDSTNLDRYIYTAHNDDVYLGCYVTYYKRSTFVHTVYICTQFHHELLHSLFKYMYIHINFVLYQAKMQNNNIYKQTSNIQLSTGGIVELATMNQNTTEGAWIIITLSKWYSKFC